MVTMGFCMSFSLFVRGGCHNNIVPGSDNLAVKGLSSNKSV